MVNIQDYTLYEVEKNLIAIEQHLAHFSNDKMFCISCLKKHFSYLEMLAEEIAPVKCALNPLYLELKQWAVGIQENLNSLNEKQIKDIAVQSRDYRKGLEKGELEMTHLQEEKKFLQHNITELKKKEGSGSLSTTALIVAGIGILGYFLYKKTNAVSLTGPAPVPSNNGNKPKIKFWTASSESERRILATMRQVL